MRSFKGLRDPAAPSRWGLRVTSAVSWILAFVSVKQLVVGQVSKFAILMLASVLAHFIVSILARPSLTRWSRIAILQWPQFLASPELDCFGGLDGLKRFLRPNVFRQH
jgi:hypothetical protein